MSLINGGESDNEFSAINSDAPGFQLSSMYLFLSLIFVCVKDDLI